MSDTTNSEIKNEIKIQYSVSDRIEIFNLSNGKSSFIVPKDLTHIRLTNTNLFKIPIENKELNIDNFHAIKQLSKYSDYFTILNVVNGVVTILPIVFEFKLKNNEVVGMLI